jgi:hypothetical protein
MRKKHFLLFLFFLFSFSLFTLWGKIENNHKDIEYHTKNDSIALEKEAETTIPNPRVFEVLTQEISTDNRDSDSIEIYHSISIIEAKLSYAPRPFIKPIMALRINAEKVKLGDTLSLENIEGLDYTFRVSYIQPHKDGSQSITARYTDEAIPYTMTMTQSSIDTFITFATPKGSYEIEAYKGVGYVYKTQDIRQYLSPNPIDDSIMLDLSDTIK